MNINNKKILIFLMTIMLCQFQMLNLKADDHSSIDAKDNLITGKSKAKSASGAVQIESWKENY